MQHQQAVIGKDDGSQFPQSAAEKTPFKQPYLPRSDPPSVSAQQSISPHMLCDKEEGQENKQSKGGTVVAAVSTQEGSLLKEFNAINLKTSKEVETPFKVKINSSCMSTPKSTSGGACKTMKQAPSSLSALQAAQHKDDKICEQNQEHWETIALDEDPDMPDLAFPELKPTMTACGTAFSITLSAACSRPYSATCFKHLEICQSQLLLSA